MRSPFEAAADEPWLRDAAAAVAKSSEAAVAMADAALASANAQIAAAHHATMQLDSQLYDAGPTSPASPASPPLSPMAPQLSHLGGRELVQRIHESAVALAEKDFALLDGEKGALVPLLQHAVGKPAGCLCLELCEPSAEAVLRSALPRLESRVGVDNPAWQLVRFMVPMLAELRRRLAIARSALKSLHAVLPPPPADAAPLSAIAVGRMLLAMAAEGSEHPGAEAARLAAPKVSEAMAMWQAAAIAEALGPIASDLALQAHTLAGHLKKALPAAQGNELLQGIGLMAPPAAVLVLAAAPRIDRIRKLAATGSPDGISPFPATNQYAHGTGIGVISGVVISTPAAQATTGAPSAPTPRWAQLLAQQLLLTLWRLHYCGVLPAPPASKADAHQMSTNALAPLDSTIDSRVGDTSGVSGQQTASSASLRRSRALPHSADGAVPPRAAPRAAGASMPTYTMAATGSVPRLMPQGALQRPLGGKLPSVGQLPFRTLIGRLPDEVAPLAAPQPQPGSRGSTASQPMNKPPPLMPGTPGSWYARLAKAQPSRESAISAHLSLTHSKSAPGFC